MFPILQQQVNGKPFGLLNNASYKNQFLYLKLGKNIMKKSMLMYTEEFTLCLNWQQKKWKIEKK
jgi:hypothetical protein